MNHSLAHLPNYVVNAFAHQALVAYQPEDIRLGVYTFLPWVRTGLASIVQNPAPGQIRATVTVGMDVADEKGGKTPVQKTVTLRGPGDVLGLQPSQIVRRFPAPNAPDAQHTYLAYVEFDRPELPWLFTPFAPSGPNQERLPPWLALVVLEARHASFQPAPPSVPPGPVRVRTRKGELQPLNNSWAFAHAQVPGDTGGVPGVSVRADGAPGVGADASTPSVGDRLTGGYAPVNLSRLLCPRRLEDGVTYVACIVPAFDCGVKAALGLPGGTLDPAWVRTAGDDDQEVTLPVYDHWRFSTAKGGDFEELARRLVPVKAPWRVGRRFIDAHHPRGGVARLGPGDEGRLQVLKCALFSPAAPPADAASEDSAWSTAKREELREELNQGDAVSLSSQFQNVDLPRVGARLYARYQRGAGRLEAVDDGDWFSQLNTTPAHRIIAGLGTRVVQKDQEQLMQSAWAQVGPIDKANQALVRAQYARYLGTSLHKRHIGRLSFSSLVQVTRAVQGKLKLEGSALSLRGELEHSFVAPAAADWPFRRAVRPRGAVARILEQSPGKVFDRMVAPEGRFRDFRREHVQPDGVVGLRSETLNALPAALVARILSVPERNAIRTLQTRLGTLAGTVSTADRLMQPVESWSVRPDTLDVGELGGRRLLEILRRATPSDPAREPARAESVGGLLRGIAESGIPDVSPRAREETVRIVDRLPEPIVVRDAGERVVRDPGAGATGTSPGATTGTAPGAATGIPRRTVSGTAPGTVSRTGGAVPIRTVTGPTVFAPTSGRISRDPTPATGPDVRAPQPVLRQPLGDRTALLDSPTTVALGMSLGALRRVPAVTLAGDLASAVRETGFLSLPTPPDRKAPGVTQSALVAALEPAKTVTSYVQGRFKLHPSWLPSDWFKDLFVQPIMAAPEFKRPMYEALDAYNRDWLVPGLGLIERTDFVTLLMTNPAFTEGFLVGLSDEMGRELLWRGYPTDQRGTYFKHFWDDDEEELTGPIHRFSRQPLGHHVPGGGEGRIVFVVRGALVNRFPDAIMMALRQVLPTPAGMDAPVFADPRQQGASAAPIFHASLPPDILLVGFDLTAQQVKNQRWWFFIAEHPTAPRFGLDVEGTAAAPGSTVLRNDLDWNDIARVHGRRFIHAGGSSLTIRELTADPPPQQVAWPPASSAVLARVFLQNPIRAAFDGSKLLDDIGTGEG